MKNIFLTVCSIVAALASAEIGLRMLGMGASPAFAPHPQYGYLMKPNQWASTRGNVFHINSAGFRGNDFASRKLPGTFRLVFVGDSVTYGGGSIPETELFANRVAAALQSRSTDKTEAINLSAPGWGVANMAGYIAMNGVHGADVVIWIFPECDFRRLKTTLEEHRFRTAQPWSRLLYMAYLASTQYGLEQQNDKGHESEAVFKDNVDLLMETLTRLALNGTRVGLVVLPSENQAKSYELDTRTLRTAAGAHSIPILDATQTFQLHRSEDLYLDGAHLSRNGHKVMAEAISDFLWLSIIPAAASFIKRCRNGRRPLT